MLIIVKTFWQDFIQTGTFKLHTFVHENRNYNNSYFDSRKKGSKLGGI